jgi:hypothetical protein
MPPPRSSLDPNGYYALLNLTPDATREAIVAAYRARARQLHPDVPVTGNAAAFLALKQAYDVLSNQGRRVAYDRDARSAAMDAIEPEVFPSRPVRYVMPDSLVPLARPPRLSDMPVPVWIGLGLFLTFCLVEVFVHLRSTPPEERSDIPATAQAVAPLTQTAHDRVLYGPTPVNLPGTANFYVSPAAGPTTLYHLETDGKTLLPAGQLPPFSTVQGLRLFRQSGMIEIVTGEPVTAFIQAGHLTPGNLLAAHQAYCGYNAGKLPQDGEVLDRAGDGGETLSIDNRAVEPAVIRLRDAAGRTVASVFLSPGSHADVSGLPAGDYRPEYAIGELWSRACNGFAAGMRAWRLREAMRLPGAEGLVVTDDKPPSAAEDISDQVFEQK